MNVVPVSLKLLCCPFFLKQLVWSVCTILKRKDWSRILFLNIFLLFHSYEIYSVEIGESVRGEDVYIGKVVVQYLCRNETSLPLFHPF